MAVVEMCKMRIIGLKNETRKILETLSRSHCFEAKQGDYTLPKTDNTRSFGETNAKQARLQYAIEYLNKQSLTLTTLKKEQAARYNIKPNKPNSVRPSISADEFFAIKNNEEQLLNLVNQIDKLSFRQNDIKQEMDKLKEEVKGYEPYLAFPFSFSMARETKKTSVMLFSGAKSSKLSTKDLSAYTKVYAEQKHLVLVVIALLDKKEEVVKTLNEQGFSQCPYSLDFTARQAIDQINRKKQDLDKESEQLFKQALNLLEHLPKMYILHDYYSVIKEQYSLDGLAEGGYITVIEGWCPLLYVDKLKDEISSCTSCAYFDISQPTQDESVPTLLKNNQLVSPFEDLTEMYTVSDYKESDPNKFMGFWFFFIFGLMLGDVVYGLVLFAATHILLKVKKLEPGTANLVKMFRICSLSTFLWGIVFGSFAGQAIPVPQMAFSFASADSATGFFFGWFSPMDDPIMLFGLGLIVGIFHLIFGYGLNFAKNVRNGKIFDGICEGIFPSIILVSLLFLGANIFYGIFSQGILSLSEQFLNDFAASVTSSIGLILLLLGLGGLLLTTGRASLLNKNLKIPMRVGGWLGGILNGLNGIIGLVSDILSYSRIFGLGLAGAAIGFAFNTLVELTFFTGGLPMIIIGILLMIFLHIFNLGISLLSTYVHNARLQFLEYYGKFLDGEGKAFTPLGLKTKYVRF